VLISDSNVRPGPDYLRRLRGYQQVRGADLVSTLLCGVGEGSVGARLENLQLNSWVVASVCFTELFGHPCVIGKTMFLRRGALEVVGGLEGVRDILAEDYTLGARFTDAGFKVVASPYVLRVVSGARDLATFFNRHLRWGQMRRRIAPLTFLLELASQPAPWFALTLLLGGPSLQALAVAGLAAKYAVEVALYYRLAGRLPLASLLWIPLKDLLVFAMWFGSATRTTVIWRGNRMRIGPESRLTPLEEPAERLEQVA
jgi:ceramide glucosyltransferase